MRELATAGAEELISYDSRIWATLRALFLQPGLLTRDHFEGRRARYVGPFRIFVITNIFAWLLIPSLKIKGFQLKLAFERAIFVDFWRWALQVRAAMSGVTVEQFSLRIEAVGAAEDSVAVLCMSPLLAAGVAVLLRGRGLRFVQHLVYAAHFYCIHLITLIATWALVVRPLINVLAAHPDWPTAPLVSGGWRLLWLMHLLVALPLFPYMFLSLRRAYALTTKQAWWRALLLSFWACVVTRAFLDVAFVLVLLFA